MLVQRVIQSQISVPLAEDIQAKILDPLKMDRSTLVWYDAAGRNIAFGHDSQGMIQVKRQWSLNAAGSLHASLADYWRFARLFVEPDPRFKRYIAEMKKPVVPLNYAFECDGLYHPEMEQVFPGLQWGSGIAVEKMGTGTRWFQHGKQSGFRALFCADDAGRLLVFFANGVSIKAIRRRLFSLLEDTIGPMIKCLEL